MGAKPDIIFGKKDFLKDSDFDPQNVGHKISIVIPEDVLMAFRAKAKKKRIDYQALINQVLRAHLSGSDAGADLEKRVKRLEKAVFGRRVN